MVLPEPPLCLPPTLVQQKVEEWDDHVTKDGDLDLGEIAAQYLALSIDRFAYVPETDSIEIELPPG